MKKAKKKKKLLVIGALLFLGALGAVGYQQLMAGQEDIHVPGIPRPGYFKMKPFLAPVMEGRRIGRYISLGITLELYDDGDTQFILGHLTPLRNAFIQDLHFQAHLKDADQRPINLRRVKARFRRLADRVLGPDIVKDVLISHALDRGF